MLALALLACTSPASIAQSLSEVFNLAARNDSAYQSAKASAEASLARAAQNKALILPTIGLSASRSATRSQIDSQTVAGGGFTTLTPRSYGAQSYGLNLSLPLFRPALWATYAQGQQQAQLAQAQFQAAAQDLMVQTAQAYFDVVVARENLRSLQAQEKATQAQLAAAKRNFEVGNSTITDAREAQAQADLIAAQLLAAQNDLQNKQLALDTLTGLAEETRAFKLKPKALPNLIAPITSQNSADARPLTEQAWIELAETHSFALAQARTALEVAELEMRKALAGHLPTLDVSASLSKSQTLNGTASSALNNRTSNRSVNLSFNLPLFAGFATQERIKETQALRDKAQADFLTTQRSVRLSTKTLLLQTQTAQAQIKAYEAAERSSLSALEATKLGYQVGVRINADILAAQTQLYQTQRDLVKARIDAVMIQLRLLQTVGQLSLRHLEEVDFFLDKTSGK